MRPRFLAVLLVCLPALSLAAPPDAGFRLEPKAEFDDVFGDTTDFRRIIDQFLGLTDSMQRTRDQFARAIQAMLADLRPISPRAARRTCSEATTAPIYGRALALGQEYLRAGRELTRFYEQVREYDRLGETIGLTPDYRARVKRVVAQYSALVVDYREMKVAFHDQLGSELRYAGCNPDKLAARAGAVPLREEAWPEEAPTAANAVAAPVVNPIEKIAPAPKPRAKADSAPEERAGVLFYIDNTRCSRGTHVTLDGHPIGDVPAATRAAFSTTLGPHDLCLAPDGGKKCGDPGTLHKSYLSEGWTIALRCD